MWGLPVLSSRADEAPLGVFTVFSDTPRTPTPAELAALQDLTGLASLLLERALAQTEMQRLATYDGLTGLPNRALYLEYLTQALSRSGHTGERLAVGLLDLDRFKVINDTLGHSAGDELLGAGGAAPAQHLPPVRRGRPHGRGRVHADPPVRQ